MGNAVTTLEEQFCNFVLSDHFSCVAAKAAVQSGGYRFGAYGSLADPRSTAAIARDLRAFLRDYPSMPQRYKTFVAAFDDPAAYSEQTFEDQLWRRLQLLHAHDSDTQWAPGVSEDPADTNWAFSFGGRALFVVGMHPNSSRISRRFSRPALIFNPHEQFSSARREGRFERVRANVRKRELTVQGSLNPNLADFGTVSEARQYSGRKVEQTWACPFHKT